MKVLMVDNYDSFTYNLVQGIQSLGAQVMVVRNDAMSVAALRGLEADRIVLSPGPGTPADGGVCCSLIAQAWDIPVLGVCLGHQCLAVACGGRLRRVHPLRHGKTSPILHDGRGVFCKLASPFEAARYHSWVVDEASLPSVLEVSARTPEGEIMGLRHRSLPYQGVQFHPESVATPCGLRLLESFLEGRPPKGRWVGP